MPIGFFYVPAKLKKAPICGRNLRRVFECNANYLRASLAEAIFEPLHEEVTCNVRRDGYKKSCKHDTNPLSSKLEVGRLRAKIIQKRFSRIKACNF